jgi:hypothetical protein
MVQNWNRFYDPSTGRYLEPDPALSTRPDLILDSPAFSYARNNPIAFGDPNGRYTVLGFCPNWDDALLEARKFFQCQDSGPVGANQCGCQSTIEACLGYSSAGELCDQILAVDSDYPAFVEQSLEDDDDDVFGQTEGVTTRRNKPIPLPSGGYLAQNPPSITTQFLALECNSTSPDAIGELARTIEHEALHALSRAFRHNYDPNCNPDFVIGECQALNEFGK